MWRSAMDTLTDWLNDNSRKPLILRGARQVGKTWLVRQLANFSGRQLIELNFEKNPQLASLFVDNEPHASLKNIAYSLNLKGNPAECLLFLDEIQAAPELLAKLRWFYEELPELPVIAAGSLLEFVLGEHQWSMPVGRVTYHHLEPLNFYEFLKANKQEGLCKWISEYHWGQVVPVYIHEQLMNFVNEYTLIGGMPAAVANWQTYKEPERIRLIHQDLLGSYRDDFGKYSGRVPRERLEDVLMAVPAMLGEKFQFSRANPDVQAIALRRAVDLLHKARVCHRVHAITAEGLPLNVGKKDKIFKMLFIDIGLALSALGYEIPPVIRKNSVNLSNRGGIAEQLVGQILRSTTPYYMDPELFYWVREKAGTAAEIDYISTLNNQLLPIEVKAGQTGTLRSLHYFMAEKKLTRALRVNADMPSRVQVDVKTTQGKPVQYELFSLPFYLCGQFQRLLSERENP